MMALSINAATAKSGGCDTATAMGGDGSNPPIREDRQEAQRALRERLQARDENTLDIVRKGESLTFSEWTDFFLENYSKPPIRAIKTHAANKSAVRTLRKAFGTMPLIQISPLEIEAHLRARLQQRKTVRRKGGVAELPKSVKPTTVHQEYRVLRRILSVAVKKKLCRTNPCAAVEFPVSVKGLFRPYYMSWSEARNDRESRSRISAQRHPDHYRNWFACLQGTRADAEGTGGSGEPCTVRPGFEDSDRRRGGSSNGSRSPGVYQPT